MNERIKELALKASDSKTGWLDRQKFADLIRADERDRMCERFNLSKELAHEKAKGNETN